MESLKDPAELKMSAELEAVYESVRPSLTHRNKRMDEASADIRAVERRLLDDGVNVSAWVLVRSYREVEPGPDAPGTLVHWEYRDHLGWAPHGAKGYRLLLRSERVRRKLEGEEGYVPTPGEKPPLKYEELSTRLLIDAKGEIRLLAKVPLQKLFYALAKAIDPLFVIPEETPRF